MNFKKNVNQLQREAAKRVWVEPDIHVQALGKIVTLTPLMTCNVNAKKS